jgi:hypothetical protein
MRELDFETQVVVGGLKEAQKTKAALPASREIKP